MPTNDQRTPSYTVPGISPGDGEKTATILQQRLDSLNDLALTLKHVHWNVVGPHFIAVHQMIDPQVDDVRGMVDDIAERIATLGVSPQGTIGGIVKRRSWHDYSIGRGDTIAHLGAVDHMYQGIIAEHRQAATDTETLDMTTNDMLVNQLHSLELFHWFVRAHLESSGGTLSTSGTRSEHEAASAATDQ